MRNFSDLLELARKDPSALTFGASEPSLRLDSETIAAALWYCDLRGFTAMSEDLPRDDVIALLNDYFECMSDPVHAGGGEQQERRHRALHSREVSPGEPSLTHSRHRAPGAKLHRG